MNVLGGPVSVGGSEDVGEVKERVRLVHGLPSDNDGRRRVDEGSVHVEKDLREQQKRTEAKGRQGRWSARYVWSRAKPTAGARWAEARRARALTAEGLITTAMMEGR